MEEINHGLLLRDHALHWPCREKGRGEERERERRPWLIGEGDDGGLWF